MRRPRQGGGLAGRPPHLAVEPWFRASCQPLREQPRFESFEFGFLPRPKGRGRGQPDRESRFGPKLRRHPFVVCVHIHAFFYCRLSRRPGSTKNPRLTGNRGFTEINSRASSSLPRRRRNDAAWTSVHQLAGHPGKLYLSLSYSNGLMKHHPAANVKRFRKSCSPRPGYPWPTPLAFARNLTPHHPIFLPCFSFDDRRGKG